MADPSGFKDNLKTTMKSKRWKRMAVVIVLGLIVAGVAILRVVSNRPVAESQVIPPVLPATDKPVVTVNQRPNEAAQALIEQQQRQQIQDALKTGQSATPNVLATDFRPREQPAQAPVNPREAQAGQLPATIATQPQQQQQIDDARLAAMRGFSKALFDSWESKPTRVALPQQEMGGGTQAGQQGRQAGPSQVAQGQVGSGQSASGQAGQLASAGGQVLIPAGTIRYGQTTLGWTSKTAGPPLEARLTGDPLDGALLLGSASKSGELAVIRFDRMSVAGKEIPIEAVAIDPATSLPGVASDVDHQYFSRFVLRSAATFLAGFAQVFSQPPQTFSQSPLGVTTIQQPASTTQAILAGAGKVGADVAAEIDAAAKKDDVPIVTVWPHVPIGIVFLKPVEQDPTAPLVPARPMAMGGTGLGGPLPGTLGFGRQ